MLYPSSFPKVFKFFVSSTLRPSHTVIILIALKSSWQVGPVSQLSEGEENKIKPS